MAQHESNLTSIDVFNAAVVHEGSAKRLATRTKHYRRRYVSHVDLKWGLGWKKGIRQTQPSPGEGYQKHREHGMDGFETTIGLVGT